MSNLQTPQHRRARSILRIAGPIIGSIGFVFLIVGMCSFFSAFGGGGQPDHFWCCFVGMPLLFIGTAMCMFGYMGALARYTTTEYLPTAVDATSEMAEGTKGAVKTVARAVAEGVIEAQKKP